MNILVSIAVWMMVPLIMLKLPILGFGLNTRLQKIITLLSLCWASFWASIRFETGGDWGGYLSYYNEIDISQSIADSYFGNALMLQFEPGYFVLSYLAKYIGLSFSTVNSLMIIILVFTFFYIIKKLSIPGYFVIFTFIGLPLLTLFYNQERMCVAVAFVLLAVVSRDRISFLLFSILAVIFHLSVFIFLLVNIIVKINANFGVKIFKMGIIFLPIFFMVYAFGFIDFFDLIFTFMPEVYGEKIMTYKENKVELGVMRYLTTAYIMFVAIYMVGLLKKINLNDNFQSQFVISSILISLLLPYSFVFSAAHVFYARTLMMSLIFLSISGAIFHNSLLYLGASLKYLIPVYGLGVLSLIYYFFILFIYSDGYVPYKSILFN